MINYMQKEEMKRSRLHLNLQSYSLNQTAFLVISTIEIHIESRGRFSQLLKQPWKNTVSSKEEEKEFINFTQLQRLNKKKDDIIDNLKKNIEEFKDEKLDYLDDRSKLAQLYDLGVIESAGNVILANLKDDQEERSKEDLMRF